MLKFFRKIRQSLLSEGNTGKYFKYAIGEIVLVVIGILIALQINNWNERRKENLEQKSILTNFSQDLKEDQNNYTTYLEEISRTDALHQNLFDIVLKGDTLNSKTPELIRRSVFFNPVSKDNNPNITSEIENVGCKPTASNKIYIDENGDRYFKEDSWNGGAFDIFRLSEEDWEFVLESDLIAMPAGDPNLEELLKRRTKDHVVVVDFLDYLGLDFIEKHIDAIDLVFLSGKEEMLADLQALSTSKHTLLVPTLGAQGSLAFYENKMYKQEALEVETIVDSTGCGDAFQAAFCLEWIGSKDIQNSLYAGALAAQKVLGYMGGVNTDF